MLSTTEALLHDCVSRSPYFLRRLQLSRESELSGLDVLMMPNANEQGLEFPCDLFGWTERLNHDFEVRGHMVDVAAEGWKHIETLSEHYLPGKYQNYGGRPSARLIVTIAAYIGCAPW